MFGVFGFGCLCWCLIFTVGFDLTCGFAFVLFGWVFWWVGGVCVGWVCFVDCFG